MVVNDEIVIRVLFPNKILRGKVMGGAFALRPQRGESHLSVFRLTGPTFKHDLGSLCQGRNLDCAKMEVSSIRQVSLRMGENIATCDVTETGDILLTSHAGIVSYINSQQLIGGHASEIALKAGASIDALILALQHRLASIAQKGLVHANDLLG